ncbi:MAG: ATP-binding protein [candidate division WOR-3 bacterium]
MREIGLPLIIILIPFTFAYPKDLPFQLKEIWRVNYGLKPYDMNGDGTDEFLNKDGLRIRLMDNKLKIIWDRNYPPSGFESFLTGDFNKDGFDEIFATIRKESIDFITVYDGSNIQLTPPFSTITKEDKKRNYWWYRGARPCGLVDANEDGLLDIIVNLSTYWGKGWRGLAVFDLKTGKKLWEYLVGPMVGETFVEDLNGDGKPEIFFETSALSNGVYADNTDDFHTYVIVLNNRGKLLWQKEIGGYFSRTFLRVSDLDLDGNKEIVVALRTIRQVEESDSLMIFDGADGKVKKSIKMGSFMGLECADLNQDGKDEIVAGNRDGELRVFDQNLSVISSFRNPGGIELKSVFDTDGDEKPEIFIVTADRRLVVLNGRLKEIAEAEIPIPLNFDDYNTEVRVSPVKEGIKRRILLGYPKEEMPELTLLELVPAFVAPIPIIPTVLLIIFGITIITLAYLYVSKIIIHKIQFPTTNLLEKAKEGYIILNKKGKVLFANETAVRILEIENLVGAKLREKLIPEIAEIIEKDEGQITIKKPEGEIVLAFKRSESKQGFLIRIEDITKAESLKRIEGWAPVAQKLAHGIKNPLSTILGAVEQIEIKCEDEKIKKYLGYIKDEVTNLKKMADAFMRFTKIVPPVLVPKSINEVIKKVIGKYETGLAENITIKCELDGKLPLINFDEEGISNALNIIIENGIEAVIAKGKVNREEGVGILKIRTLPIEKLEKGIIKEYVRIEISDTGTGIPERYLEKVCEPYFTYNKPLGTGLGLTLAKKIIEDHKGYIEIHSKEGVGTEVNVYLPLG